MDELFSCVACDHPATEHNGSGCASCSCSNPLDALADDIPDATDDVARTQPESSDEHRLG
jgi:hypothetical protein